MTRRPAWSLETARPICRSAARGLLHLFKHLPEFDYDDLFSEALKISLEEHASYDPARGSYAGWLSKRIRDRLRADYRAATGDRCRREAHAATRPEAVADERLAIAAGAARRQSGVTLLVGRRIKKARRRRSLAEVAREAGVSPGRLSELERGLSHDILLSTLTRLATVLGVQARDLIPAAPWQRPRRKVNT